VAQREVPTPSGASRFFRLLKIQRPFRGQVAAAVRRSHRYTTALKLLCTCGSGGSPLRLAREKAVVFSADEKKREAPDGVGTSR
ncbi:hypothetical protein, partial [uncultured Pseudomonas sp.]|uniref:hypothetical protein n=1 Tax=uncultured Pseudomonas sp. TaxID=114707 RepID=UPI0025862D84